MAANGACALSNALLATETNFPTYREKTWDDDFFRDIRVIKESYLPESIRIAMAFASPLCSLIASESACGLVGTPVETLAKKLAEFTQFAGRMGGAFLASDSVTELFLSSPEVLYKTLQSVRNSAVSSCMIRLYQFPKNFSWIPIPQQMQIPVAKYLAGLTSIYFNIPVDID